MATQFMYSYAILCGMKNLAFEAVCKFFGSQRKLARILGVSPAMVNHALYGRRPIPEHWCPLIEKETRGQILCEQLRPDVCWSVLRQTPVSEIKRGK